MSDHLRSLVSDEFVSAKEGKGVETYQSLLKYYRDGSMNRDCHYAFGWIIYYAMHQSPDYDIIGRKNMLAVYLKLQTPRPHKLHSMILTEAIRLSRNAKDAAYNKKPGEYIGFSIVSFMTLWNFSYLRPGDWRIKEHEGQKLPSTVEKLVTVYTDELENNKALPGSQFIEIVEEALEVNPTSVSLLMHRATLHIIANEKEAARNLLRKALLLAPGKFFLWSRLASLISTDENMRLHVALLHKALCSPGQEQYKGRIRLQLAQAFVDRGAIGEALYELSRVKACYETNGWHLPKAYEAAIRKIPANTQPVNPDHIYTKLSHLAEEEIYGAITPIEMVKTYHKPPSDKCKFTAWRVTDSQTNNYWLQPHRWGIDPDLPHGSRLQIRLHLGKVVHAQVLK